MPIIVGDRQIVGDLAGEIARLEALVSDLERLANGGMPTEHELAAAPLLHPFTIGTLRLPCLIGGNVGHPIRTGPVIRTSEVWAMAPEQGWARTYSRFYRLGEPMFPMDAGMRSSDDKCARWESR